MATKTHDIIADLGRYKDRQGNERKIWRTVGVMFDTGAIKLNVIPVGPEWSGWLKAVEPESRDGWQQQPQQQATPQQQQGGDNFDDGTPF